MNSEQCYACQLQVGKSYDNVVLLSLISHTYFWFGIITDQQWAGQLIEAGESWLSLGAREKIPDPPKQRQLLFLLSSHYFRYALNRAIAVFQGKQISVCFLLGLSYDSTLVRTLPYLSFSICYIVCQSITSNLSSFSLVREMQQVQVLKYRA